MKKRNLTYWRRRLARVLRIPIILKAGIRLNIHKVNSVVVLESLCKGLYESQEIDSLRTLVKASDRVLELGTGLGYVTCHAARLAHQGKVLSFEANRDLLSLAEENLRLNRVQNAEVRNAVLGAEEGTVDFFVSEHFWASSLTPEKRWEKVSVNALSWKDVLNEFDPTVIIMDIEGGEYELLQHILKEPNQSLDRMSIEFHKSPNPETLFAEFDLTGWETNFDRERLINRLRERHETVVFTRKTG